MDKLIKIKSSISELTFKDYKELWYIYDDGLRHFKNNYGLSNLYKAVFPSLVEECSELRNHLIKFSNSDSNSRNHKKTFILQQQKALKQIDKIINAINDNMVRLKEAN